MMGGDKCIERNAFNLSYQILCMKKWSKIKLIILLIKIKLWEKRKFFFAIFFFANFILQKLLQFYAWKYIESYGRNFGYLLKRCICEKEFGSHD